MATENLRNPVEHIIYWVAIMHPDVIQEYMDLRGVQTIPNNPFARATVSRVLKASGYESHDPPRVRV